MSRATDRQAAKSFWRYPAGCPFDKTHGINKTELGFKDVSPAINHLAQESDYQYLPNFSRCTSAWPTPISDQDHECDRPV